MFYYFITLFFTRSIALLQLSNYYNSTNHPCCLINGVDLYYYCETKGTMTLLAFVSPAILCQTSCLGLNWGCHTLRNWNKGSPPFSCWLESSLHLKSCSPLFKWPARLPFRHLFLHLSSIITHVNVFFPHQCNPAWGGVFSIMCDIIKFLEIWV